MDDGRESNGYKHGVGAEFLPAHPSVFTWEGTILWNGTFLEALEKPKLIKVSVQIA